MRRRGWEERLGGGEVRWWGDDRLGLERWIRAEGGGGRRGGRGEERGRGEVRRGEEDGKDGGDGKGDEGSFHEKTQSF